MASLDGLFEHPAGVTGIKEFGADVAKRAPRGLRLANDFPKTEPDARPGAAAVAGALRRGHNGASHRTVGRCAGTDCRYIFPAGSVS